jgi:hypothetical protein
MSTLPSHVSIHRNVLANRPFTPTEWVAEMNALGSDITLPQYEKLLAIIGLVAFQGTHDRGPEKDHEGKYGPAPIDRNTGKPLQEDNEYDIAEVKLKNLLLTSLQRHVNMIRRGNKWPDSFGEERPCVEEAPPLPDKFSEHSQKQGAGQPFQPGQGGYPQMMGAAPR